MGLFVVLVTWFFQWFVASGARARAPHLIPGKFDESLGHDSFVFRAHRTFMNSIENVPALIGTSFLAIHAGASPLWTGILIWVFALARIIHMVLYYVISTEKNPSPRSYFFLLGLSSNIALLVLCGVALV